ncbi:hypothetical protein M011DRAFT_156448 [Sporormia fimetaria CBS 119925]|uniref:Uncharacterized protein n=1 Tax=Sporormia fimetaria CBS 119925 TaxID=1340428 RepID=A0A6A6V2H6_9PLEO|nr:hypothetical protein M011DRAFT_156448 [Sporormia fimetaria CBS 119925]
MVSISAVVSRITGAVWGVKPDLTVLPRGTLLVDAVPPSSTPSPSADSTLPLARFRAWTTMSIFSKTLPPSSSWVLQAPPSTEADPADFEPAPTPSPPTPTVATTPLGHFGSWNYMPSFAHILAFPKPASQSVETAIGRDQVNHSYCLYRLVLTIEACYISPDTRSWCVERTGCHWKGGTFSLSLSLSLGPLTGGPPDTIAYWRHWKGGGHCPPLPLGLLSGPPETIAFWRHWKGGAPSLSLPWPQSPGDISETAEALSLLFLLLDPSSGSLPLGSFSSGSLSFGSALALQETLTCCQAGRRWYWRGSEPLRAPHIPEATGRLHLSLSGPHALQDTLACSGAG